MKYVRVGKNNLHIEIELEKAIGVPLPDQSMVGYEEIVGREIRIGLFEENFEKFHGNLLNLECRWTPDYEDRYYFDLNNIDKEQFVLVKLPLSQAGDRNLKFSIIFELVNFVRKNNSNSTTSMTAGFAMLNLSQIDRSKTYEIPIVGGSPFKEKRIEINPNDIRHKRRGFLPTISSIFEGKITPKLIVTAKRTDQEQKSNDFTDEVELLPDQGVFQFPQIKIMSYFRQCMGQDAFCFSGNISHSINTSLSNEVYIKSFCYYFCMPRFATYLSHFWNMNVVKVYSKSTYEDRTQFLKEMLINLYPSLKTENFQFDKSYPTDMKYGIDTVQKQRMIILRNELDRFWGLIQQSSKTGQSKIVPAKYLDPFKKDSETTDNKALDIKNSAFSIDELMEDFEIG